MIYFPRKTWVKMSQIEVDEQMNWEWISIDGVSEDMILKYIINRIESAEKFADERAMRMLLQTYGLKLI